MVNPAGQHFSIFIQIIIIFIIEEPAFLRPFGSICIKPVPGIAGLAPFVFIHTTPALEVVFSIEPFIGKHGSIGFQIILISFVGQPAAGIFLSISVKIIPYIVDFCPCVFVGRTPAAEVIGVIQPLIKSHFSIGFQIIAVSIVIQPGIRQQFSTVCRRPVPDRLSCGFNFFPASCGRNGSVSSDIVIIAFIFSNIIDAHTAPASEEVQGSIQIQCIVFHMAVFVEIIFISIVIEPAGSYAAPASEAVPFSINFSPAGFIFLIAGLHLEASVFHVSVRIKGTWFHIVGCCIYLLPAGKEFSSFCIYQIPGRTYCQPAYGTVFLLIYGVVSKRYGAVCIQIVGMRYPFFIDNSLETCLFYAGAVIAKQICFISYLLGLAPDGIAVFIRIVIVYASIIKFECNKFISFQFRCKYFSFTDTLLHRTKSVFCRIFPFCIQVVGSGFSIFIRKFYFTGQHVAVFIKHITDTVDFYWSGSSYHLIILIQNSVLKLFLSISFNAVPAFLQITYFRSRSCARRRCLGRGLSWCCGRCFGWSRSLTRCNLWGLSWRRSRSRFFVFGLSYSITFRIYR